MALSLAACATPVAWQKPGADREQAAFDLQSCRSKARGRLQSHHYFAHERAVEAARAADDAGRGDGTGAVAERWDELRQARDLSTLVEECMHDKGYRPVKPETSAA